LKRAIASIFQSATMGSKGRIPKEAFFVKHAATRDIETMVFAALVIKSVGNFLFAMFQTQQIGSRILLVAGISNDRFGL